MLGVQNNYSEPTTARGRDLVTISLVEIVALAIAWGYLHAQHAHPLLPAYKVDCYGTAFGITVLSAGLVIALTRAGRLVQANAAYVALLLLRAVLIGLPDGPGQGVSPYLVVYSAPIIAADVLLNRRVAALVAGLSALACFVTALPSIVSSVVPSGKPASVFVVVLFTIVVLTGAGILLGTFAGDPYVDVQPDLPADTLLEEEGRPVAERRHLTHRQLAEALTIVMRLGSLMLGSGAASFRTEQVMVRVAHALGVERLDTYVTPNGVVASAYSGPEHRTQIVKIPRLGVAMDRVVEIETFTHGLRGNETPAEISAAIDGVQRMKTLYPVPVLMAAAGVACGALAAGFGGGWQHFAAAGLAACGAQGVRIKMHRSHMNPILTTAVCAFVATAVSVWLIRLLHPAHQETAVLASVLLLVPGVPLVTSIVDLTRLDLLSGVARGVLALLMFVSIAAGMLMALLWTGFNIIR